MAVYGNSFLFDGISCIDYGIMIASFDGGTKESSSCGSEIDLKKTYISGIKKFVCVNEQYSNPITKKIQCIKIDKSSFSPNEISGINRFYKRSGYKQFQIVQDDYEDICMFAKCISIDEIIIGNECMGLEFNFETNSPISYSREYIEVIDMEESYKSYQIINLSDEEGAIFPYIEIFIKEDCNFSIHNNLSNNMFEIKHCVKGETITFDQEKGILLTNNRNHNLSIYNDYNYVGFDIYNTFNNFINNYDINGKAKITIKYRFEKKVGL